MTLGELLREREDSIALRWLEDALATYSSKASEFFMGQQDPFANPVGHSFRIGTKGLLRALLDGSDGERVREFLHEIVKIRAVQQFPASEAIGFLFLLKDAVRAELGTSIEELRLTSELATFEGRIDRMALVAFDMFVECREQVFQLRVNEAKRRVSWVVDRMNQRSTEGESG
jgi:hypothetical protein